MGVTTAPAAPTVTITTDLNDDGTLSAAELGSATTVGIKVDLPIGAQVGDTLNLSVNGGTPQAVLVTQSMLDTGYTTTVPRPADGSTLNVSATVTDVAGNVSAPGSDSATVGDTTPPLAPTVTITTDLDDDGSLSAAELGSATTVGVQITLPAGAQVGDRLNLSVNGGTPEAVVITQSMLDAGYTTSVPRPADGATLSVSATVTDAAGNVSAPGSDSATVGDTTAPAAPTVTITTDLDDDGTLSAAELGRATTVGIKVDLPVGAQVGDTLNLSVNGGTPVAVTITQSMLDAGYTTSVPRPVDGGEVSVSATITDAAGNASAPGSDSATVGDTTAPSVVVTINANGTVSFEFTETPVGFDAGDVQVANGAIANLRQDSTDSKHWTADLTALQGASGELSVSVADGSYTDSAGNAGAGDRDSIPLFPPSITVPDTDGTSNQTQLTVIETAGATAGTFTLSAPAGVNQLVINSTTVDLAALSNLHAQPVVVSTASGVLRLLSFNPDTGVVGYTYDPGVLNHSGTGGTIIDGFSIKVSDALGMTESDQLRVGVLDSIPAPTNDYSALAVGRNTLGNVLVNDSIFDVGGRVTSINHGGVTYTPGTDGKISVITSSGTLVMSAEGAYTYTSSLVTSTGGSLGAWKGVGVSAFKGAGAGAEFVLVDNKPPASLAGLSRTGQLISFTDGIGVVGGAGNADYINGHPSTPEAILLDLGRNTDSLQVNLHSLTNANSSYFWAAYDENMTFVAQGSSAITRGDMALSVTSEQDFQYVAIYGVEDSANTKIYLKGISNIAYADPAQDVFTYTIQDGDGSQGSATLEVSTYDSVFKGTVAGETVTGTARHDLLDGGTGNDQLFGGAGNDVLIGGAGNDQLWGELGADVFTWKLGDQGTASAPAIDTVKDFSLAQGDALDLRDLLADSSGSLGNYLQFSYEATTNTTVLAVKTDGAAMAAPDQIIRLEGVDLVSGVTDNQQIIQNLINNGKLITE